MDLRFVTTASRLPSCKSQAEFQNAFIKTLLVYPFLLRSTWRKRMPRDRNAIILETPLRPYVTLRCIINTLLNVFTSTLHRITAVTAAILQREIWKSDKPSISPRIKILNLKYYLFFIYSAVDYDAINFYFICSITREIYLALLQREIHSER